MRHLILFAFAAAAFAAGPPQAARSARFTRTCSATSPSTSAAASTAASYLEQTAGSLDEVMRRFPTLPA